MYRNDVGVSWDREAIFFGKSCSDPVDAVFYISFHPPPKRKDLKDSGLLSGRYTIHIV